MEEKGRKEGGKRVDSGWKREIGKGEGMLMISRG